MSTELLLTRLDPGYAITLSLLPLYCGYLHANLTVCYY